MQFSETAKSITPAGKGTVLSHILTISALEGNNPLCAQHSVGQPAREEAECSNNSTLQHERGNSSAPIHHQEGGKHFPTLTSERRLLPFIREAEITHDSNNYTTPEPVLILMVSRVLPCMWLQKLSLTQSHEQSGCPAQHRAAAVVGCSSCQGTAGDPTPPTSPPLCPLGVPTGFQHKKKEELLSCSATL